MGGHEMNANGTPTASRWLIVSLVILFLLSLAFFNIANFQSGMEPWQIFANSFLLAIPLLLLFSSIGLFVTARRQHAQGVLSKRVNRLVYYTPRIAGIIIALFVGLFSLDVFGAGGSVWEMIGAFILHSLPSIFMGVLLILAWRRPVIGFAAFLLVGIFFLRFLIGDPLMGLGNLLLFAGPMLMIALLFWANWKWGVQPSSLPQP
jgi:hypothetical protein